MDKLSTRTKTLLLQGASTLGNFTQGFYYIEERLTAREADIAQPFCEWLDREIGGASSHNIDSLYAAYKNPNNPELTKRANEIAEKIKSIKILTNRC